MCEHATAQIEPRWLPDGRRWPDPFFFPPPKPDQATCVGVVAADGSVSDDLVYVVGAQTTSQDQTWVRITRYYSSNSPATAAAEGLELTGADWYEINVARGRFWPHDVSCVQTASPDNIDEPVVYICGEKPGQLTTKNYFILAWAKDLKHTVAPGQRVTGPVWSREFHYQPNATFVGSDVAKRIHASGSFVAVTGSSDNPDGTRSIQTLIFDRQNGITVLPEPALRLTYPGYIGEPAGVRLVNGGALGELILIGATFHTPNYSSSFIVAQAINIATGLEVGRTLYTPPTGARVSAVAIAMEPDGLGMFLAGSQNQTAQSPAKLLLARLDITDPIGDWATTFTVLGGTDLNHQAAAMAVGRDGQLNTMIALTGIVDQTPGSTNKDMLTVLYSGIGSQLPNVRWFSVEDPFGGDDRGRAIAIQPDFQLDQWRVYVTGFVTTPFGDRDWRTMMFKSPDVAGNAYPAGTIIRHDYSGPAGDDEPAAMHLSHPGLDRKFFIVGNSFHPQSAQDFYSHKYEDITP